MRVLQSFFGTSMATPVALRGSSILRLSALGVTALVVVAMAGCATVPSGGSPGAAAERPGAMTPATGSVHVVQRGETLYRIASSYGVDWRTLAESNGIRAPYTIHPGQRLQIRGSSAMARDQSPARSSMPTTASRPTTTASAGAPNTQSAPTSSAPRAGSERARSVPAVAPGRWQWPAEGPLIRRFSNTEGTRRGIGIAGSRGDPVRAAADGEVVYAGSGLVGYGRLLILKHDDRHLTAYAHNDDLLVSDGDRVRAGQQIAAMGASGTDRVQLHFEVRVDGQPVDPLRYLPAR